MLPKEGRISYKAMLDIPLPGICYPRKTEAEFSRARLSRLTFLKVFCLLTSLSDLEMIGVFTSKIARARIN